MESVPLSGPMEWSLFGYLLAGSLTLLGIGVTGTLTGVMTAWRMRGMIDKRDREQSDALQKVKDAASEGLTAVKDGAAAALTAAKDEWDSEARQITGAIRDLKDAVVQQITDSRHELRSELSARAITTDGKVDALTRTVTEVATRSFSSDEKLDRLQATMDNHTQEDRELFKNHGERIARLEPSWQGQQQPAASANRKRN